MSIKKMLKIWGLAGLFVLYSGVTHATNEKPLALFYISVQEALASNNLIKQSEARLAAAMTLYAQAKAVVLPTVSLDWQSSYTNSDWRDGSSNYDPHSLTLSASQTLYNLSAIREMDRVDPQVRSLELDLEGVRQQVYFSLIQAATALIESKEVARLAKNNLEVTEHHLEATKARFSVGEVTKTDVSQAISRVAIAKAAWIRQNGDSLILAAKFQEIAGIPFPTGLQIPIVLSDLPTLDLDKLIPLVKTRPDILSAQYRLQGEKKLVEVTKAGHYPTVSLKASGSRTWNPATSLTDNSTDAFTVTVAASLPLYSGGLTTAQVKQAQSNRDNKQADLDLLRIQAERELKQVLAKIDSAKATDLALKTAVTAAQEAKDGVDQEYQVGSRTSLDLLDAQNELFSAQIEQVKSQFAVNLAMFELLQVLGRLTPQGDGFDLILDREEGVPHPMAHDEESSPQIVNQIDTLFPIENNQPRWTIQIAALHNEKEAVLVRDGLNKKGGELFIQQRVDKKSGKTLYLVRFGNYKNKNLARKAQKEFSNKFKRDSFVTAYIK
ncbi:MAG: TolC family outer membrane protein [Magnetococcales bacterium]|nr:TolC family outer membrane protein [Magnetococcales bacterium]